MVGKARKREKDRKRIFESRRYTIMLWCAMAAIIIGSTATFAWYGASDREADSAPAEIMKPYYLNLRNPSDKADLQLSVGNLFPGDVKQVVFCVSNKNNEKNGLDMGVTSFEYSIELIHTENLALEYEIYELEKLEAQQDGAIVVLDTVEENDTTNEYVSYFQLAATPKTALVGEDVFSTRHNHNQVGLTGTMPVNAGKYTSYTKSAVFKDAENKPIPLKLEAGEDVNGNPTFDSQFFLIEIDWEEGADDEFEKYEKETDMIYLLVEALQPKPEKKETTQ